ncbi:MAG: hypothetical protein AAF549_06655 [Pseudomonadota bacterium]
MNMSVDERNAHGLKNRAKKINEVGELVAAFIEAGASETVRVSTREISLHNHSFEIRIEQDRNNRPVTLTIEAYGEVSVSRKNESPCSFEVNAQEDREKIRNDICFRITRKASDLFKGVGVDLKQSMDSALSMTISPATRKKAKAPQTPGRQRRVG